MGKVKEWSGLFWEEQEEEEGEDVVGEDKRTCPCFYGICSECNIFKKNNDK